MGRVGEGEDRKDSTSKENAYKSVKKGEIGGRRPVSDRTGKGGDGPGEPQVRYGVEFTIATQPRRSHTRKQGAVWREGKGVRTGAGEKDLRRGDKTG